ncbi:hypothetical protein PT276_06870 [Orbaceae bacterium ESL0721]|nr:hypothetical protein [Orbaceae bacterium ESL0721]
MTSQPVNINRIIRITSANARPIRRALSRCAAGTFSTRMAINTMLSIPKTISRIINVDKPIQIV